MGIFGWSYPPGCSGPPDDDGNPVELKIDRPGYCAFWDEDDTIYVGTDNTPPPAAKFAWDDALDEDANIAAATAFAQTIVDRPAKALKEIMERHDAGSIGRLYRDLYKYSDCGMGLGALVGGKWVYCDKLYGVPKNAVITALQVSSIVEGVEQTTGTHEIDLTQDKTPEEVAVEFDAACDEVEKEAAEIWNATHGCETCAQHFERDFDTEAGDIPVWEDCPDCDGGGTII